MSRELMIGLAIVGGVALGVCIAVTLREVCAAASPKIRRERRRPKEEIGLVYSILLVLLFCAFLIAAAYVCSIFTSTRR